ncbi:MAG: methyltransferase domain-containing protein [Nitrospira sp.]
MANEQVKQIDRILHDHLTQWGLRRLTSTRAYLAWEQREASAEDLAHFDRLAERRRGGDPLDDTAFYDLSVQPPLFAVLHSQRYDYYQTVGKAIASRIREASTILDVGCGAGILTTFYARLFPDRRFVGIDRSSVSIQVATQKAKELGLGNVSFRWLAIDSKASPPGETYDLILSSHVLVQHEWDSGIPSESWRTFARGRDAARQLAFERRTGVGAALDWLSRALAHEGRMIVVEKTRQLARRVPFQRAVAARGFHMIEKPQPIRYQLFEDAIDDGPLYHLKREGHSWLEWDESPEPDDNPPLNPLDLRYRPVAADAPLYENHKPSAQQAWERLNPRIIVKEATYQEPDGRAFHVELGTSGAYVYLYCANSFDQRQLVVYESRRAAVLEDYYRDITEHMISCSSVKDPAIGGKGESRGSLLASGG